MAKMANPILIPIHEAMCFAKPDNRETSTRRSDSAKRTKPADQSVFRRHRFELNQIAMGAGVESLFRLAQPMIIGLAINDLLQHSYRGTMLYIVLHLMCMAVHSGREMYNTRLRTKMYTKIADQTVQRTNATTGRLRDVSISVSTEQKQLSEFERIVPALVTASISGVGGLLLIGWFEWSLIPVCCALLVPLGLLNSGYGYRLDQLQRAFNSERESEPSIIQNNEDTEIREHFRLLSTFQSRISDAIAVQSSLKELFILGLVVAVIVRFSTMPGVIAGDIFAVVTYVLLFVNSFAKIPQLLNEKKRLQDPPSHLRSMKSFALTG